MKVNILGTDYIIKKLDERECPKLALMEANGLAELYSKELIINKNINEQTGKEYDRLEEYEKKVLRHEIIHAFFHESGLDGYTNDEVLIDFLALQVGKMVVAMQKSGCLS